MEWEKDFEHCSLRVFWAAELVSNFWMYHIDINLLDIHLTSTYIWCWLVVWTMFSFSIQLEMSSSQLTNSIIFQRGWFNQRPGCVFVLHHLLNISTYYRWPVGKCGVASRAGLGPALLIPGITSLAFERGGWIWGCWCSWLGMVILMVMTGDSVYELVAATWILPGSANVWIKDVAEGTGLFTDKHGVATRLPQWGWRPSGG